MNRLVNTLKGRWRVFAIVSVALVAVLTGTAQATSPDSTPEPGYAWIDGYISDWDTGISEPPSDINAAWPSRSCSSPCDTFGMASRARR